MLSSKRPIGTIGVMCGLPAVLEKFSWSLANMVDYSNHYVCAPNERIELARSSHSFHSLARNQLADEMLGDWLLQLDADHEFAPDLLARMLNIMNRYSNDSYQIDVVAGLYLHRNPPYNPTLWDFVEKTDKPAKVWDWREGELHEFGVAGTGCLLVRRRVFDRIREELKELPFSTSEFPGVVGEDFAFARRCRRLGIRVVCAPWIECHHLEVRPLKAALHYKDRVAQE